MDSSVARHRKVKPANDSYAPSLPLTVESIISYARLG